jgi:predicted ATPase
MPLLVPPCERAITWQGTLKLSRLSFAGVYLHGSVGSGKSLMLDLLAAAVAREAAVPHLRRLHFNSAMLELHRWGLS